MPNDCESTILIVDDHPEIADSVREILEDEGYPVEVARDGEQVLKLLPAMRNLCLVLLDLRLPRMNGNDLVARIRDHHPGSVIVAVTGAADVPKGYAAVLRKPFEIEALLDIARRYCEPRGAADATG
jgi:UDP-3-O-[3-hydroxymyristoyl] N-acetylglucosamine deacetylase